MMRTEPLLVCQPDENEFVDYAHLLGYPKHGEYAPYFHDRYKNPLHLEGAFANESLFIVCGGPSLNKEDLELLKTPGVITMTINNACVNLLNSQITPNFSLFCDMPSQFIKQMILNPAILKLVPWNLHGKKLWDNERWCKLNKELRHCNRVAYFTRNEKHLAGRFFRERTINWGSHKEKGNDCRSTFLASLKIAYVLGFRKVYLLGVDFDMREDNTYSFNEVRSKSLLRSNTRNYKILSREILPKLKVEGEKLGFVIFNCNRASNLKIYDYITLEGAVKSATSKCSPTETIATKGLYNVDYKDKCKLTRQQAVEKVMGAKGVKG